MAKDLSYIRLSDLSTNNENSRIIVRIVHTRSVYDFRGYKMFFSLKILLVDSEYQFQNFELRFSFRACFCNSLVLNPMNCKTWTNTWVGCEVGSNVLVLAPPLILLNGENLNPTNSGFPRQSRSRFGLHDLSLRSMGTRCGGGDFITLEGSVGLPFHNRNMIEDPKGLSSLFWRNYGIYENTHRSHHHRGTKFLCFLHT
ncbi:hypothetical protein Fmac_016551 [Flemingia macrophylla]|uniref:Uncharacterized protein n=1 Tax=Flemingia macrophylla TaxID=520843 RepID=A0ABD1MHP6_9FABA